MIDRRFLNITRRLMEDARVQAVIRDRVEQMAKHIEATLPEAPAEPQEQPKAPTEQAEQIEQPAPPADNRRDQNQRRR